MSKIHRLLNIKYLLSVTVLLGLFCLWVYKGIAETGIHVDLARDLNFLSDLWIHKVVWLGPMTSANFPASPIYYYLLFPGLLLSGGNGLSLIFSQAFFALLALGLFAYFQLQKSFISTILVILAIGLSPWWITAAAHPWNGYMYVSWVFLALTCLWFKKPLVLSALLFGIAIAINPVAILALPVLFYEWWISKERVKGLIHITIGLLLPWGPIIAFEIITKGFLIKQWLAHPAAAGMVFSPKLTNLSPLSNTIGISPILAIIILIFSSLIGTKRTRYWMIFIGLPVIFMALFSPWRQYYLLGITCAVVFITVTTLSTQILGRILLILFILSYLQTITIPPLILTGRSIPGLSSTITKFIQTSNLDTSKKYAVVSIRDLQNSTPQADDYRFFLRVKGIKVLAIDQYSQADRLLLFVEVPHFNWQDFSDWHINQFGQKKLLSHQIIDGIEIILYGR